jgi:hypothetical protein
MVAAMKSAATIIVALVLVVIAPSAPAYAPLKDTAQPFYDGAVLDRTQVTGGLPCTVRTFRFNGRLYVYCDEDPDHPIEVEEVTP